MRGEQLQQASSALAARLAALTLAVALTCTALAHAAVPQARGLAATQQAATHLHQRLASVWAAKVQQRRDIGLFQARLTKDKARLALRVARRLHNLAAAGRCAVQGTAGQRGVRAQLAAAGALALSAAHDGCLQRPHQLHQLHQLQLLQPLSPRRRTCLRSRSAYLLFPTMPRLGVVTR